MPRLLLVDDNPSIHRIAESLLAPTDVELVCVASAAEALDRIGSGEHFDVALVDTAMPGMDGWTLLERLRGMEEAVRMPIALMAGVLDPVDPAKLAKAPIQGFLKKPIELRELGDRVKVLLATPVVVSPSAVSTVPYTTSAELLRHAEAALPELRPEPAEIPTGLLDADLGLPEPEEDLLVLTADDLWPEEPIPAQPEPGFFTPARSDSQPEPAFFTPARSDMRLELEELDLASLQDLAIEPLGEPEPAPELAPEALVEPAPEPALSELDQAPAQFGMEELETVPTDFIELPLVPVPAPVAEPVDVPASSEPEEPAVTAAAAGQEAAVPGQEQPLTAGPVAVSSEQAQALLNALLAEPVLMDTLVKALVARMGDQVLREIAWEVMPDLAGRLQR